MFSPGSAAPDEWVGGWPPNSQVVDSLENPGQPNPEAVSAASILPACWRTRDMHCSLLPRPPCHSRSMRKMAQSIPSLIARGVASAGSRSGSTCAPALALGQRGGGKHASLGLGSRLGRDLPQAWCAAQQSKSFSSKSDSMLLSVLAEEVDHEKQTYEAPSLTTPADWTLQDSDDSSVFKLTKRHKEEQLEIELDVNSMDEDVPEGEEGAAEDGNAPGDSTLIFDVNVIKGDEKLLFECRFTSQQGEVGEVVESFLEIQHAALQAASPSSPEHDRKDVYDGPVFMELDEKLQAEWDAFLAERGVTPELALYLQGVASDKEQRLYMRWLQRVTDFVRR